MVMKSKKTRRTEEAIVRALRLADRIAKGDDLNKEICRKLQDMNRQADYSDRRSLCIEASAWDRIQDIELEPSLVFAHPKLLEQIPESSLYYRGLALLSRKRVSEIAGNIDTWERGGKVRTNYDKALKLSRLYNTVISSIIIDDADWTYQSGYRNILATIGITEDGGIRNFIGSQAEQSIKRRLLEWVKDKDLMVDSNQVNINKLVGDWELQQGVFMIFRSEPDVAFAKDGKLRVLIEIKGGKDPAGALERLGAIKKTFDEAPINCKNYLVVGVVTNTMEERLSEMRIEEFFHYDLLINDQQYWNEFIYEIFHHGLRII